MYNPAMSTPAQDLLTALRMARIATNHAMIRLIDEERRCTAECNKGLADASQFRELLQIASVRRIARAEYNRLAELEELLLAQLEGGVD